MPTAGLGRCAGSRYYRSRGDPLWDDERPDPLSERGRAVRRLCVALTKSGWELVVWAVVRRWLGGAVGYRWALPTQLVGVLAVIGELVVVMVPFRR